MPTAANGEEPPRNARWHARHEEIIDAAAHIFATNGYHATGIAELCSAVGLGKGALYYYIGSKEQLLVAIHDRVMDEVLASADRVVADGGSPRHQLTMLGDELLDIIARYPDHVWVFLHEFPVLTGEWADQFRRRRRSYETHVEAILRAGVASGEFRQMDVRLASLAWLGMHNYTYLWLKASGPRSAHEVAATFADFFINGIGGR